MYVATVWYRLNHGATADLTVRKSLTVALTKDPNLTLRNSGVGAATYGIQEDMPQSSNPICFKEWVYRILRKLFVVSADHLSVGFTEIHVDGADWTQQG